MLRNIRIQGFRGIEYIELEDLGNINVLIGENNSGKTSVLEAIQLLGKENVLPNLYSIAMRRENSNVGMRSRIAMADALLFCFNQRLGIKMLVEAQDDLRGIISVEIQGNEHEYIDDNLQGAWHLDDNICHILEGEYRYCGMGRCREEHFEVGGANRLRNMFAEGIIPIEYLNAGTIQTQHGSLKTMYNVMRSEERRELIELLRIFDERIVGIDKAIRNGRALTFLELEDIGMMPLSTFGDGVKKVLAIANVLVKAKGGIVLIDEFETGIHKSALRQVTDWLIHATKMYEVQVFLTTHSSEAMDALLDAVDEYEDIRTYRLEQFIGRTYVKKFDGKDLDVYRNNRGMDIF